MFPQLIRIGSFALPTYGALVASGFLIALLLAARLGERAGLDPDRVSSLGVYVAIAAIVGAKAFYVLGDFSYYSHNPSQLFSLGTLRAGGVFYGGLLPALAVAIWYLRRSGLPALRTADTFAPALALGHAIGRVGCFAAGCCWGRPARLPWAVTFTNPVAREIVGVPLGIPLHPTQLYEAAAELVIFFILWVRFRRPHRDGSVIGLYLLLYSAFRFAVEFWRDPTDRQFPFGGPLTIAQWTALGLVAAGAWLLVRRRRAPLPAQS